jgi:hypothetical protein
MSVPHSPIYRTRIKHSGRFDFDAFYKYLYALVVANGYDIIDSKHTQKQNEGAETVEVEWSFDKFVDDYTQFRVNVELVVKNLKEVVIKRGDSEIKTSEGDVSVAIQGKIFTDWQNLFEKNKFLLKLRAFYERYLFKKTYDDYEGDIYGEVSLIAGELKSFLKLP